MIVLIMGVSGVGKSTVGARLAEELGWRFIEADHFHPKSNIEKMSQGHALTDADRTPWLKRLNELAVELESANEDGVLACSALRRTYREILLANLRAYRIVYLRSEPHLLESRISNRSGHFMPASLLESQFRLLEPPDEAIDMDAGLPLREILRQIRMALPS